MWISIPHLQSHFEEAKDGEDNAQIQWFRAMRVGFESLLPSISYVTVSCPDENEVILATLFCNLISNIVSRNPRSDIYGIVIV